MLARLKAPRGDDGEKKDDEGSEKEKEEPAPAEDPDTRQEGAVPE